MEVIYQNVRGLNTKLPYFRKNLHCLDCHLVAVTETFLRDGVNDGELAAEDWSVLRKDRNNAILGTGGGGGVLLLARPGISLVRRRDLETDRGEDLWASVIIGNTTFYVCVVYIPPRSLDSVYWSFFEKVESFILSLKGYVIIVGDINLNPQYSSKSILNYYCYFTSVCNLYEKNNVKHAYNGQLDVVLTQDSFYNIRVSEIDGGGLVLTRDLYHPPLNIEITYDPSQYCAASPKIEPSNIDTQRDWSFSKGNYELLYMYIYRKLRGSLSLMPKMLMSRLTAFIQYYTVSLT